MESEQRAREDARQSVAQVLSGTEGEIQPEDLSLADDVLLAVEQKLANIERERLWVNACALYCVALTDWHGRVVSAVLIEQLQRMLGQKDHPPQESVSGSTRQMGREWRRIVPGLEGRLVCQGGGLGDEAHAWIDTRPEKLPSPGATAEHPERKGVQRGERGWGG
jgi:hypothetical protein